MVLPGNETIKETVIMLRKAVSRIIVRVIQALESHHLLLGSRKQLCHRLESLETVAFIKEIRNVYLFVFIWTVHTHKHH